MGRLKKEKPRCVPKLHPFFDIYGSGKHAFELRLGVVYLC
jgi:hypothetical protein